MMCCSDNYRAITLSSVVGKVLDWVILQKEQIALNSSDLEFGFKPNVSTTQCTFALNESISYYNSRKTNVYVALLDATKQVNNKRLNNITSAVHLGHCISTLNKNSLIDAAGAQFWKSFNIFSVYFGHIYPFLQCELFTQHCCSFYEAPLWNFVNYNNIFTAWRMALRKMWHASPMTHCNIIALLSESKAFRTWLDAKIL